MQSKWYGWLVLLIGILLIIPMFGVAALGTLTSGFIGWFIPIIIILLGILGITKAKK